MFGMTRTTRELLGKMASICGMVMPIATETNNLLAAIDLTSSSTVGTTFGLTDTNTMSESLTTGAFLVIVSAPSAYGARMEPRRTESDKGKKGSLRDSGANINKQMT